MRYGSAVLFVLAGIWSIVGGSCAFTYGREAEKVTTSVSQLSKEMFADANFEDGKQDQQAKEALKKLARAETLSNGLITCGIVAVVVGGMSVASGLSLAFSVRWIRL